jgi:outer membrane protein assembly factor BamB
MSQHFAAPIFAVPCIDATRQRVYVAVEDRFLYAFNSAQFNVEWKLNVSNALETNGSNTELSLAPCATVLLTRCDI